MSKELACAAFCYREYTVLRVCVCVCVCVREREREREKDGEIIYKTVVVSLPFVSKGNPEEKTHA